MTNDEKWLKANGIIPEPIPQIKRKTRRELERDNEELQKRLRQTQRSLWQVVAVAIGLSLWVVLHG